MARTADAPIDWPSVRRVLVVKLRSIGDTVLATPSLIALRRFLPSAEIDIVLEDWVAPLLDGFEGVNVIPIRKGERLSVARGLRKRKYDLAFNLHGGTTATFLVRASGARHRVGLSSYQYSFLYNNLLSSGADFWKNPEIHSAEQQLALLGHAGVPVEDRPRSRLAVTDAALTSIGTARGNGWISDVPYALIHPATAFHTKQWPAENFARVADFVANKGLKPVAIASPGERQTLTELQNQADVEITAFDNLTLPEITALASKARVFVGNDSGIAHIAAAVDTPSVVIFGSSNRVHWRPWTDAPNQMVFNEFHCQPCAGYECREFGAPRCILEVPPSVVFTALERVLAASKV
jgi:ADP-heptose:LPS heptosyltransferase